MVKKAASDANLFLTAAQWAARWEEAGQSGFAAEKERQFDCDVLASAIEDLCTIPTEDPEAFALLAKKGLDQHFFSGLAPLGNRLRALLAAQPPDRRRAPVLSPADKRVIDAAGEALAFAKSVAASAGFAVDRIGDVKVLGRGVRVVRSPAGIHDGLQLFVANLDQCADILADGGFGEEEIDELKAFLPQTAAILTSKGKRVKDRDNSTDEMDVLALGIESALHLIRARVNTALRKKPLLRARTLGRLPRTPDRRAKGGSDEGEGTGDGSAGTGDGTGA